MNTRTFQRSNYRTSLRQKTNKPSVTRRRKLLKRFYPQNRQNRRYYQKTRRNRLQRVQNILGFNRNYQQRRQTKQNNNYSKFSPRNNQNQNQNAISKREVYIKGLPRYVDNKGLFNLFKNEGRIVHYNILYDNVGFSKGVGKIEFADFRDALNVINKWNNSTYKGVTLKAEYKKMQKGKIENGNNSQSQFRKNNNYNNGFSSYQNYSRKLFGNGYNNYYKNNYNYNYQRAYY